MPKQTFTISDFTGGMNEGSDMLDIGLVKKNQVITAADIHFDSEGHMSRVSSFPTFDDHQVNVSGDVNSAMVELNTQIGGAGGDNLGVNVDAVSTETDDLSWEDGIYDFKYTVCKDLSNGIIEEGPLQAFQDATIDSVACDATSVNMNTDDLGKFTFKHEGQTFPSWKAVGSIIGRVYYSRQSGQGSSTQVGWIHLCDLIYGIDSGNHDRIRPRAVGLTGNPANNIIDIEEPPTSASFEMNAGYPSDVGILDISDGGGIFNSVESKVVLGMITYVAKSGYIYRSLPGQPDIFPTDGWIDMTKYGTSTPCKAMYGIGDLLCYFTANELVLFNVSNDTIAKEMRGFGISDATKSAQVEQGVVWVSGTDSSEGSPYYFDGQQINDINKKRVTSPVPTAQILYNEDRRWLKIPIGSDSEFYVYSFSNNTWFRRTYEDSGGTFLMQCILPGFTANEPGRWKKLHKVVVHGGGSSHTVVLRNEQQSSIASTGTDAGQYYTEWVPNSSTKFKELYIVLKDPAALYPFRAVSIIYRPLNKF